MKTKRRVQVPKHHREANSLSDLSDLLFPHTPITVEHDFTLISGEKVYEWHIYVEGEWFDKEKDLSGLASRLYEIIESQGGDWDSPSLRVVPDWPGWSKIGAIDLASVSVLSNELRKRNSDFYDD